jgi:hypothetical protein
MLPAMYDIRNNRNVGHVGGDVVANKMDATYLRDAATWVLAELIRIFHQLPIGIAQKEVDALVERVHPLIWEHDGKKRVLDPMMKAKDKVLVLLHSSVSGEAVCNLQHWTKYKSRFHEQVLQPLADDLLVELSSDNSRVIATPLGLARAEKVLAKFSIV